MSLKSEPGTVSQPDRSTTPESGELHDDGRPFQIPTTDASGSATAPPHTNGPQQRQQYRQNAGADDDNKPFSTAAAGSSGATPTTASGGPSARDLANTATFYHSMNAAAQYAYFQYHQYEQLKAGATHSQQPNANATNNNNNNSNKDGGTSKNATPTKKTNEVNQLLSEVVKPPPPPPKAPPATISDLDKTEDWRECKPCGVKFTDAKAYHGHCRGGAHTMRVLMMGKEAGVLAEDKPMPLADNVKVPDPYEGWLHDDLPKKEDPKPTHYCKVCNVSCSSKEALTAHLDGKRHQKTVRNNPNQIPVGPSRGSVGGGPSRSMYGSGQAADDRDRGPARPRPGDSGFDGGERPTTGGAGQRRRNEDVAASSDELILVDTGERAHVQSKVDNHDSHIIGVDSVYEIIPGSGELRYFCEMCNSKMDPRALFMHLTGRNHRMTYLKERHAELYGEVFAVQHDKTEQNRILLEKTIKCEKLYGRGVMRQKRELLNDQSLLTHLQRKQSTMAERMRAANRRSDEYDYGAPPSKHSRYGGASPQQQQQQQRRGPVPLNQVKTCSNFYDEDDEPRESFLPPPRFQPPSRHRLAQEQAAAAASHRSASPQPPAGMNLKNLLSIIAKSAIKNEEDADFAFAISQALTKALVQYRLQNPSSKTGPNAASTAATSLPMPPRSPSPKRMSAADRDGLQSATDKLRQLTNKFNIGGGAGATPPTPTTPMSESMSKSDQQPPTQTPAVSRKQIDDLLSQLTQPKSAPAKPVPNQNSLSATGRARLPYQSSTAMAAAAASARRTILGGTRPPLVGTGGGTPTGAGAAGAGAAYARPAPATDRPSYQPTTAAQRGSDVQKQERSGGGLSSYDDDYQSPPQQQQATTTAGFRQQQQSGFRPQQQQQPSPRSAALAMQQQQPGFRPTPVSQQQQQQASSMYAQESYAQRHGISSSTTTTTATTTTTLGSAATRSTQPLISPQQQQHLQQQVGGRTLIGLSPATTGHPQQQQHSLMPQQQQPQQGYGMPQQQQQQPSSYSSTYPMTSSSYQTGPGPSPSMTGLSQPLPYSSDPLGLNQSLYASAPPAQQQQSYTQQPSGNAAGGMGMMGMGAPSTGPNILATYATSITNANLPPPQQQQQMQQPPTKPRSKLGAGYT